MNHPVLTKVVVPPAERSRLDLYGANLQRRCEAVARGRKVSVVCDPKELITEPDYTVEYSPPSDSFAVQLRPGGCFDGAARCIERWIAAEAERLDGHHAVPAGYIDLRQELDYWAVENLYAQFRSDLELALNGTVSWLQRDTPPAAVFLPPRPEVRQRALRGLQDYVDQIDAEVASAVLSPMTVSMLRRLGFEME
jgi:hypothetical protein